MTQVRMKIIKPNFFGRGADKKLIDFVNNPTVKVLGILPRFERMGGYKVLYKPL